MSTPPERPSAQPPTVPPPAGEPVAETLMYPAPLPVPATEGAPLGAPAPDTLPLAGGGVVFPAANHVPGYEMLGELGRGGMGVVYLAQQISLNRAVALKMILAGGYAGLAERMRFKAEAEAVAKLQHPNIVAVYEVGEHDGRPFLSLEFCPGGSLDKQLNGAPLAAAEAARLAECLARAMHFAHQKGVVHRDLKPANVLLGENDSPKITDFGLAKLLDGTGQTVSGAVLGTPSYMAPEQARGKSKEVGPAADVYALGAILYELLTGRPPFRGETSLDTLSQVMNEEAAPPRRLNPGVPRDLEAICRKCLEKDPGQRYASALDLAEDLHRFQEGEPVRAGRRALLATAARALRRHRRAAVLVGVALLTAVATALFLGRGAQAPLVQPDSYAEVRRPDVEREVAAQRRGPPARIISHPPGTTAVERIPTPDNSAFEILGDARVWDLRAWRRVPPGRKGELICAASMKTRLRLRKLREAKEYAQQSRTSGAEVFIRCLSPKASRVLVQKVPSHVGLEQTKTRQCLVDVSDVPVEKEFDLRFVSTFWNSLQTDEDRWVGIMGYRQGFKVSMLVLFPEDRPFKEHWLTVVPTARAAPSPFEGRKIILFDDKHTYLYWEILEPAEGQVYRLHWTW